MKRKPYGPMRTIVILVIIFWVVGGSIALITSHHHKANPRLHECQFAWARDSQTLQNDGEYLGGWADFKPTCLAYGVSTAEGH